MIRAFKTLRERYLKLKNSGKYFKYAIGEIILVVIRILIALQINTYNENLVNHRNEIAYLKNIKVDMVNQMKYIAIQIEFEEKQFMMVDGLLNDFYDDSNFKLDSMFFNSSSRLIDRKTFHKNDPNYTALLSTGGIALIRNESLKMHCLNIIRVWRNLKTF